MSRAVFILNDTTPFVNMFPAIGYSIAELGLLPTSTTPSTTTGSIIIKSPLSAQVCVRARAFLEIEEFFFELGFFPPLLFGLAALELGV
ncbi:hypothetical protein RRF57_004990 [Xylaria bambusicola]|uniref:Uncharacterized protein n=1 Tax=Xylaria bambusicola TaxID=326684 RepID=A0AAN7UPR2_9PEZI